MEACDETGKNKPDKIPYRINGKRAGATNPQHYSSFEETVEAFSKGGYAGIGIGCFEQGGTKFWVQMLTESLMREVRILSIHHTVLNKKRYLPLGNTPLFIQH